MNNSLFTSEVLLFIIAAIAFAVFWQLYRANDGMLRIILMAYMLAEIWVYLGSGIYWWATDRGYLHITTDQWRLIILPPKTAIMIWLFLWVRKNDNLHG